ncbi:hypothetical protein U9M48_041370 [Paspalum notatum var. saurae]|uniref:Uncharacterized protein n=1 Tax=Paspalum notatum var. saurae TaxID=547442 RepID=A0AAQ3XF74_PASNO
MKIPARPRPPLAPLPLHSTLPRQAHHQTRRDATNHHCPAVPTTKPSSSILSRAIEVAAFACVLHLYQYMDRFHRYIRRLPDTLLNLLPLPVPAHPLHGGARPRARPGAGAAVRPYRPYLATSLREFWGRRWNLMVSASVYDPVRARREGGRRRGELPRLRRDARDNGVLPPPAPAHGRDGRVLRPPLRLLLGGGSVRAVVESAGVAAAAAARELWDSGGDHVLAVPAADLQGRSGGDAASGVGVGPPCRPSSSVAP